MFINWSIDPSWGPKGEASIPAERFEVSGMATASKVLYTASALILLIGLSLMATQSTHSALFWVGTAEVLGSVTLSILSCALSSTENDDLRRLTPQSCKSEEEYLELLDQDTGKQHVFRDPEYAQRFNDYSQTIDLSKQVSIDSSRKGIYSANGKQIKGDQMQSLSGDKSKFACQAVLADLLALIQSRYECVEPLPKDSLQAPSFEFRVLQREVDSKNPEPNSRYNWIEHENVMENEQLFKIVDKNLKTLKYVVGKVRINFTTNEAVFSWSSPQDERPSF